MLEPQLDCTLRVDAGSLSEEPVDGAEDVAPMCGIQKPLHRERVVQPASGGASRCPLVHAGRAGGTNDDTEEEEEEEDVVLA